MITHILALVVGFVAGFLVHRKHAARLKATESEGRKLIDALKGK